MIGCGETTMDTSRRRNRRFITNHTPGRRFHRNIIAPTPGGLRILSVNTGRKVPRMKPSRNPTIEPASDPLYPTHRRVCFVRLSADPICGASEDYRPPKGACAGQTSSAMGRRPNPLILEYFVRGPKLNDNSNRYPHTCKQCGEAFPKGRIDSLTTHITKKCPAISESDRMRACLELHGIASSRAPPDRSQSEVQGNGQPAVAPVLPQGWSALETLAEASRQVDLNENSRGQKGQDNPTNPANGEHVGDRFELQEQFTLDNPPVSYENRIQGITKRGESRIPT